VVKQKSRSVLLHEGLKGVDDMYNQQEYTIFVESESNDRKDAVVEGVDLSSAESLFSNMIYQTDKI